MPVKKELRKKIKASLPVFLLFEMLKMKCKIKHNRRIIWASILSGLIFTGISILQLVWFLKAAEIAEENYQKRLNLALKVLEKELINQEMPENEFELKEHIFQTFFIFDTDTPHFIQSNNSKVFIDYREKQFTYKKYEISLGNNHKKFTLFFKPKSKIVQLDTNQWLWFSSLFLIIIAFSVGGFLYLFIKQRKQSEMKTDFINMLTHEFKPPVATISLISEVLGRSKSNTQPEKIQKYAGIMQAEIARLKLLVDKTLQVASFDNKTVKLDLAETQINKLLQESSEYIISTFENNKPNINLQFHVANDSIVADESHLRNVFLNLLDNSCKYNKNSIHIEIKSYQENNDLIIQITDNGIGIEKKNLPHIFDKFYRVSTGDIHDIQGSGLGLYYAKQVVEFHKGKIFAHSEPGKGTNMIIRLPKNY